MSANGKLLQDFLVEQKKLMNATAHAVAADKRIIRPENPTMNQVNPDDPEEMYNYILEKKPSHKKVLKFIQTCIDSIVDDDD